MVMNGKSIFGLMVCIMAGQPLQAYFLFCRKGSIKFCPTGANARGFSTS